MNLNRLQKILSGFSGKKIIVVGDLMLDHYLWGNTNRISPEAPVPVVEIDSETFRPGGAANVIQNFYELGARVEAIGVVGNDTNGKKLRELLSTERIHLGGVITDPDRSTTSKMRIISQGQHLVRGDWETKDPISDFVLEHLIEHIRSIHQIDAVFVSDYAKGVVVPELMDAIRHSMHHLNVPTIVDPKGKNFGKYFGVTAISPNQTEVLEALNLEELNEESLTSAGRELLKRLDLQAVYITRSEKGVSLLEQNGQVTHIPAMAKEVFDVSGAGDTTAAIYTLALISGASFQEAAYIGNLGGGIVCGKIGVATVSIKELLETKTLI